MTHFNNVKAATTPCVKERSHTWLYGHQPASSPLRDIWWLHCFFPSLLLPAAAKQSPWRKGLVWNNRPGTESFLISTSAILGFHLDRSQIFCQSGVRKASCTVSKQFMHEDINPKQSILTENEMRSATGKVRQVRSHQARVWKIRPCVQRGVLYAPLCTFGEVHFPWYVPKYLHLSIWLQLHAMVVWKRQPS